MAGVGGWGVGAELRSCVKVEVAILGSPSHKSDGFYGHKATLKRRDGDVEGRGGGGGGHDRE